MCNWATDMILRGWDVELVQRAGDMKFSLYGRQDDSLLEGVTYF